MNSCNTSTGKVQTAIHCGSLSSQSNLLGKLQECISKEDAGCLTTSTQSCLLSSTGMYTPCTFKYIGIHTHMGWGWILILSFAWNFFFFNMIQIFIWWSKCLIVLILKRMSQWYLLSLWLICPSGLLIAMSELIVQYVHGCTLSCAPAFSVQHCCLHSSRWTLRYRHGKLLHVCF